MGTQDPHLAAAIAAQVVAEAQSANEHLPIVPQPLKVYVKNITVGPKVLASNGNLSQLGKIVLKNNRGKELTVTVQGKILGSILGQATMLSGLCTRLSRIHYKSERGDELISFPESLLNLFNNQELGLEVHKNIRATGVAEETEKLNVEIAQFFEMPAKMTVDKAEVNAFVEETWGVDDASFEANGIRMIARDKSFFFSVSLVAPETPNFVEKVCWDLAYKAVSIMSNIKELEKLFPESDMLPFAVAEGAGAVPGQRAMNTNASITFGEVALILKQANASEVLIEAYSKYSDQKVLISRLDSVSKAAVEAHIARKAPAATPAAAAPAQVAADPNAPL